MELVNRVKHCCIGMSQSENGSSFPRCQSARANQSIYFTPVASDMRVERAITIRPYEIDFAGIVNNQVYTRWLEDLRTDLWQKLRPVGQTMSEGFLPVLLETHIEYKIPLRLLDPLVARMWVTNVSYVRIELAAEFESNSQIHAIAKHTVAIVDANTLKPIRIPRDFFGPRE